MRLRRREGEESSPLWGRGREEKERKEDEEGVELAEGGRFSRP